MNKYTAIAFVIGLSLFAPKAYASAGVSGTGGTPCQTSYGGGSDCSPSQLVSINKTVQNPSTGSFVDNLNVNDPRFGPDQTITFHIAVTNQTNGTLNQVVVKDVLPANLTYVSGDGQYDQSSRTLSFQSNNLESQKTQTFTVVAKIVSVGALPNTGILCETNQASATVNNMTMSDSAAFCIEKPVLGTTTKGGLTIYSSPQLQTTPATGADAFSLLGLLPTAMGGLLLRKRAIK